MTKAGPNIYPFPGSDADRYDSEFGMGLREHYAGLALQGMLACEHTSPKYGNWQNESRPSDIARRAFDLAQAMVYESQKRLAEDKREGMITARNKAATGENDA